MARIVHETETGYFWKQSARVRRSSLPSVLHQQSYTQAEVRRMSLPGPLLVDENLEMEPYFRGSQEVRTCIRYFCLVFPLTTIFREVHVVL
jgi:hypothetical protein